VSDEFDDAYKHLSERINDLKQAKLKLVRAQKHAENYAERVGALDKAVTIVNPQNEQKSLTPNPH